MDLARRTHAVLPAGGSRIGVVGVRHTHPADHDAASVRRLKGLRRVVIKANIRLDVIAQRVLSAKIAVQREVSAGVDVLVAIPVLPDALRRQRQNPLTVHTEQIRTLPHIAEDLRRRDRVAQRPVQLVRRFVNQQLAAVVLGARTEHHVVHPVLLPHLRVAHMTAHIRRIVLVLHQELFALDVDAVPRDAERHIVSASLIDVVVVSGELDVAGVVEIQRVILHKRGAGIHTVNIPRLVRIHRGRLLCPVDQIRTRPVSPVLDAARGIKRAVLIEHMVVPAVPAQAVRVVHPADRRHEMKAQPCAVSLAQRPSPLLSERDKPF